MSAIFVQQKQTTAMSQSSILPVELPSSSLDTVEENGQILPVELLLKIFGYLSSIDLARGRRVCRLWRHIASDKSLLSFSKFLKKNYPTLPITIIDERTWCEHVDLKKYGLRVDEVPHLDFVATAEKLKNLLDTFTIEGNAGGTLMLMLAGLTQKKMLRIADDPKQKVEVPNRYFSTEINEQFGDVEVLKSYYVFLSNNILQGSRNKMLEEHVDLLTGIGCEFPSGLEVQTHIVLTYMNSKENKRLYEWDGSSCYEPNNPLNCTLTRCSDKLYGKWHTCVGAFSLSGFSVCSYDSRNGMIGVSSARKF